LGWLSKDFKLKDVKREGRLFSLPFFFRIFSRINWRGRSHPAKVLKAANSGQKAKVADRIV